MGDTENEEVPGETATYDYDLIIIGGGVAGLTCAKEAAILEKKVAIVDYASPTPRGTEWGFGGTYLNSGDLPRKMYHSASLFNSTFAEFYENGWRSEAQKKEDKEEIERVRKLKENEEVKEEAAETEEGDKEKEEGEEDKEKEEGEEDKEKEEGEEDKEKEEGEEDKEKEEAEEDLYDVDATTGPESSYRLGSWDWLDLRDTIQCEVFKASCRYKLMVRNGNVDYLNGTASFTGPNSIKVKSKRGGEKDITAENFILATGMRPVYPNIEGAKELGITSDDLYALHYPPGKTLIVGGGPVGLECAGILSELDFPVEVMVRSIALRGYDTDTTKFLTMQMECAMRIKFVWEFVPTKIEEVAPGKPGHLLVTAVSPVNGAQTKNKYNTVVFATGRRACTENLDLDVVGVDVNPENGKIIVENNYRSNVSNIYAVGDVVDGRPSLSSIAAKEASDLVKRLYGASPATEFNYEFLPRCIFTPNELATVGLSEEAAIEKYGEEDVVVYHNTVEPGFEGDWTIFKTKQYTRVVCCKSESEKVVGVHMVCQNASEIIVGFAVAIKCGMTKEDLDMNFAVYPSVTREFTRLEKNKADFDLFEKIETETAACAGGG